MIHLNCTGQRQHNNKYWTHNNNIARRVSVANQSHDLNLSTCLQVCKLLNWIKFTKNFYAIAICVCVCVFVSIQVVYVIDRKFWQWFMWKCCVLRNLPKYFHSNNLSFLRWFEIWVERKNYYKIIMVINSTAIKRSQGHKIEMHTTNTHIFENRSKK